MLILSQKACYLGPTTFEIPRPNWYYYVFTKPQKGKSYLLLSEPLANFSSTSPCAFVKANIFWAKKALNVQLPTYFTYQVIHQIGYFVGEGHLRPRGQKRLLKGQKKPKSSRSTLTQFEFWRFWNFWNDELTILNAWNS